jgi:glycosyltransferase involved in cell wall biosynthesis
LRPFDFPLMNFSVAITTYNRPDYVIKLVKQVLNCSVVPTTILVIDSSDISNQEIQKEDRVKYIRSSHKNQPYQRYLAHLSCHTDIIIFLDDDLEITDFSVFEVMLEKFSDPTIRGVSVGFQHHHSISDVMDSQVNRQSFFFQFLNYISGVPVLRPGKIYMAGLSGLRPTVESQVDYFNGAIMGFYNSDLARVFDPALFSLFERKLGMGEDKAISMEIGLTKKIWFVPKLFFIHPPIASNYFQDVQSFQRKVIYSRLYLSLRYGYIRQKPAWFIRAHYYYFVGWRLLIASIKFIINPGSLRYDVVKGILQGVLLTFTLPFKSEKIAPGIDWIRDAKYDSRSVA